MMHRLGHLHHAAILADAQSDLGCPLRQALARQVRAIRAAFVYGSVAKGTDRARSDTDLMVISDSSLENRFLAFQVQRPPDPGASGPQAARVAR